MLSSAFSLQRFSHSIAHDAPVVRTPKFTTRKGVWRSSDSGANINHRLSNLSVGEVIGDGALNGDSDDSSDENTKTKSKRSVPFPVVVWRFTRPHTLIGSAIAVLSIFVLAAPTYQSLLTQRALASLAYATFPALLMNLYITGLNQITDVEIDKINVSVLAVQSRFVYLGINHSSDVNNQIRKKPYLPMASGDLSHRTATALVSLSLVVSLAMSVMHPIFSTGGLQLTLWGSFLLGTLYSLPPFRMKRFPFLAAFCIVAVRGAIINAGFYSHALSSAFGSTAASSAGVLHSLLNDWKCGLSSLFFAVFGVVIALMKDVPDAQGDRIFNIRSFTVRMGQKRVFNAMKDLLKLLLGVVGGALMRWSVMSQVWSTGLRRGLVGLACWAAAWSVNREAKDVNAEDSDEVYGYYMHLWKIFYASYALLPFVK